MSESNAVECRLAHDANDPLLARVEQTYTYSFPENERRDFTLVRRLLAEERRFELYVLLRDGAYVGFITAWRFEGFVYVEHFAIEAAVRNGGIGARAFSRFLKRHADPVVLEVEMPVEEMSKRRVGFYERLEFKLDHHVYFQPPYRPGDDWLEMRLMTYGALDLDADHAFDRVKSTIHRYVYGVNTMSGQ